MKDLEKNNRDKSVMNFKNLMRFSWKHWRKRKGMLFAATLLMLLAVVADIIYPIFSGRLIDALAAGLNDPASYAEPALYAFIGMASMGLLQRLSKISGDYVWARQLAKTLPDIVREGYYKVQRFTTNWHANSFAGATTRKIMRGMWGFEQFGDLLYIRMIPTALVLSGITISQIYHEPEIGLTFLFGLIVYISTSAAISLKYISPVNRIWVTEDSKLSGTVADGITCNSVVKNFGAERREDRRLSDKLVIWYNKIWASWRRYITGDLVQTMILYLMLQTLIGMAIWKWYVGEFSPGDVSYTMTSAFIVMGYVRDIGSQIRQMQRALNDMEDIIRFDLATLDISDMDNAKPLEINRGKIEYNDIEFSYENQADPVYQDFNLTIQPGEKVGLVGESGSGKSTFVKLLQRLYDVDKGEVLIDGQNIADVTLESLRQSISMVPQEPILFHRSLRENIAYGNPDATDAQIMEAARQAHPHEFIAKLPEGYDTMVGERGIKLSGGERQRVAIARAILSDKPILIMDEATSSLDSISENLIQDAMENLSRGRTSVIIAHRLSTIKSVDRILVFDQGRIVEQGTHAELVKKPNGRYRTLYEMQSFGMQ